MPLPDDIHFTVSIPTPGGFLARQCKATDCQRVFKVHTDSVRGSLHCPYCGLDFPNDEMWTSDQVAFIDKAIEHEAGPELEEYVSSLLRDAFTGLKDWTFERGHPSPRPPAPPPPPDKAVDSELTCPECGLRFQVDGIFGYCPGCRSENLLLYDANLALIRRSLEGDGASERELRHAYSDLVSTFEIFCRKEAKARAVPPVNFQNLDSARQAFRDALGVDILGMLGSDEDLAVRRVFQKRHLFEHRGGVIDAKYLTVVPEDAALLDCRASMSLVELEVAAHAVRHAIEVLVVARKATGA